MTYRIILTSSIMSHPLNRHVLQGISLAAANFKNDVSLTVVTPNYILEPGAIDGADMLLFVGSLSDTKYSIEHMPQIAKRAGAKSVFWSTEDPYERDFSWRAEGFDHFVSNDATSASALLGRSNVHHLPLAGCFQQDYRPFQPDIPRGIDIFFCGAPYQNRRIFVEDMSRAKMAAGSPLTLHLNGTGWEQTGQQTIAKQMTHTLLQDIYSKASFVLYLHRTLNIANERLKLVSTTPGPRLFETALAGTVQLCEFTSYEIEQYFEQKTEILLTHSGEQAYEAAMALQAEPEAWAAIAAAAQRRAVTHHCYEHRLLSLFEMVCEDDMPAATRDAVRKSCDALTQNRLALLGRRHEVTAQGVGA